jgi:hypothetical protein
LTGKFIALTALLLVPHPPDYPTDLVVHEWGTFTTLAAKRQMTDITWLMKIFYGIHKVIKLLH